MSETVTTAVEQVLSNAVQESAKVPETTAKSMPNAQGAEIAQDINKESDEYSARFAALNRREREMVQREQRLKKELESLKPKAAFKDEYEARKATAKTDPKVIDSILEEMGISFDDYLNLKIQSGGEKKEKTPQEMYQELQDRLNKKEEQELQAQQEHSQRQAQETIDNFRAAIIKHAESQPDIYTSINSLGEYETVLEVVRAHLEDTGEVMSIDAACKRVEDYYDEKLDGLLETPKYKAKYLTPKQQEAIKEAAKEEPKVEPQSFKVPAKTVITPKTLTNKMQSVSTIDKIDLSNQLEESKRRAAQLIRWK